MKSDRLHAHSFARPRYPARAAALASALLAMLATACGSAPSRPTSAAYHAATVSTARLASATVAPASGSLVSGKLSLTPMTGGVRVSGELGGLGRGSTHAIHIHEKGDCSAADASSAGAHFNPASATHGKVGGSAHHAGDMDNIVANADGVARVDVHAEGVTLGGGAANDIAGRALVVHAAADDFSSQPAGNAGARVACAVITIQQ